MNVVIHSYISARDKKSRVAGRSPKVVAVARAIAHVKYIQHRPGDDKPEDGRTFFDETEENLDGRALRKSIRELEESKVVAHKLTLSPEVKLRIPVKVAPNSGQNGPCVNELFLG